MPVANFVIFTAGQVATAQTLDDDVNARIDPRAIDNGSPGVGININDQAVGVAAGDAVSLVGKYVAPKRIVDDPAYQQYCPNLIANLLTLPMCLLETDTIFAPSDV